MDSYNIVWKRTAVKELKKIDKSIIKRIINSVEKLSNNPYPKGCRKLKGAEFTYRLRIGNYRIVYSIQQSELIIEIVKIGHRKKIYKKS